MKPITVFLLFFFLSFRSLAWIPLGRSYMPLEMNAGTQNWSIAQLPDGRMAVGNNIGLFLFDGDQWQHLPVANYTAVRSVLFDEDAHRIYVGASDEFGYFCSNPDNYHLEYHSLVGSLKDSDRQLGEVWNILRWNGRLVFQARHKLVVYTPEKPKRDDSAKAALATGVRVVATSQTLDASVVYGGEIYVGTPQGLCRIYNNKVQPVAGTEGLQGTTIRQLMVYQGGLLVATADHGLFFYKNHQVQPFLPELTPFLKANTLFCATLKDHQLLLGTVRQGVVVRNLKTGNTAYASSATGLANNTVLAATFDHLDNIWLGLDKGVGYLLQNAPYASLLGRNSDIGTGYASALLGNNLFLGTNQGLFVTPYPLVSAAIPPVPVPVASVSGQVWSLFRMGASLLCGADKGAYVVTGTKATPIYGVAGIWNFREIPDTDGLVMACDYDGLCILEPQGGGYRLRNRLTGLNISSSNFEFDADGSLWVAHWRTGIYRLELSPDKRQIIGKKLYGKDSGLYVDEGNVVNKVGGHVVVSSVDGLHRYDPATGALVLDDALSRIFARYGWGYQLRETADSSLWAMAPQFVGVAHRLGNNKWTVDTLSYNGILRQLQVGLGQVSAIDGGHLLLNSNDGFILANTRQRMVRSQCKPVIRRIVGTERDTTLYMATLAEQPRSIEIPHTLNSLRLEFAVPEYRTEQAVTYQYILEGYDARWSMPSAQTYKDYTKLGRGTYTFRLRTRNTVDGSENELQMTIVVLPAWYETWVAMVIYVVLALVALWMLLRLLMVRANRQLVREREENRRKQRENEQRIKEQQQQLEIEKEKREKERIALENEQLEQELQHKASEMADSTMNLIRKNDILQAIDEHMQQLTDNIRQEEPKGRLVKKIADIRREIQMHQNDDANWDKFAQNFNIVHNHFMDKLTARYPQLKLNDIKLCAYLKLGLSSKEIASLMNTAVRSIETARYRLRKKLELEAGDNLADFIQHLDEEKWGQTMKNEE